MHFESWVTVLCTLDVVEVYKAISDSLENQTVMNCIVLISVHTKLLNLKNKTLDGFVYTQNLQ